MPIRGVLFDIGGVLEVNPATGWQDRWIAGLDLDPSDFARRTGAIWRRGSIGTSSLGEIHRSLAAALEVDGATIDALMADAWIEYVGSLNSDLTAFFAGLRPTYRTGILSNSFVGAREREESAYGFGSICDVVVYSHEIGVLKPDPRSFTVACERLGCRAEETLRLDDVVENVEAAHDAGMRALRFLDTTQAIAAVEAALGHQA